MRRPSTSQTLFGRANSRCHRLLQFSVLLCAFTFALAPIQGQDGSRLTKKELSAVLSAVDSLPRSLEEKNHQLLRNPAAYYGELKELLIETKDFGVARRILLLFAADKMSKKELAPAVRGYLQIHWMTFTVDPPRGQLQIEAAVNALGELGDPSDNEIFIDILRKSEHTGIQVRRETIAALIKTADQKTIGLLTLASINILRTVKRVGS
jgi:HEAT repeat protein